MTETELRALRDGFGQGAACFGGEFHSVPGERWWSLSGLAHPDYNVALIHDGDVAAHARLTLEHIAEVGVPSLVMLAGRGLGAAQVLADAGWVAVGAMPLMCGGIDNQWDPGGVELRELTPSDTADVSRIVAGAFGMDDRTAASVYSDEVLSRDGVTGYGADVDGALAAVSIVHVAGRIATSWALATDPEVRRRGLAKGLMGGLLTAVVTNDPQTRLVGLTTAPAEALYRKFAGVEPVEYWQIWSRPRWMLGV